LAKKKTKKNTPRSYNYNSYTYTPIYRLQDVSSDQIHSIAKDIFGKSYYITYQDLISVI